MKVIPDKTDLNINSTPVTTGAFLPFRYTKLIFFSQTYHDLKWSDLFAYLFSSCMPSLDFCLHVGWHEACPKICGAGQEYKWKLIYCQSLKVINQANALLTRKCYNLQFDMKTFIMTKEKMFLYGWKTAKCERWQHLIITIPVWVQYWLANDFGWVTKMYIADTFPIYLAHKNLPSCQQKHQLCCLIPVFTNCVLFTKSIKKI